MLHHISHNSLDVCPLLPRFSLLWEIEALITAAFTPQRLRDWGKEIAANIKFKGRPYNYSTYLFRFNHSSAEKKYSRDISLKPATKANLSWTIPNSWRVCRRLEPHLVEGTIPHPFLVDTQLAASLDDPKWQHITPSTYALLPRSSRF